MLEETPDDALTFDTYRDKIENFSERMDGLVAEIRTAADNDTTARELIDPDVNHFLDLDPGNADNEYVDGGLFANHDLERFRQDINVLADHLTWFIEDAQPSLLDTACESLGEAIELLAEANGDVSDGGGGGAGMELAHNELRSRWDSPVRTHFTHQVYDRFGPVVGGQAKLAREIERAVRSYQEIIGRARLDSLSLASQLAGKLRVELDDDLVEGAIQGARDGLMIGGAVLGGWQLPTMAAAGRASYVMGLANIFLDGFEAQNVEDSPHQDMDTITGELAKDFIPSARQCIDAAWNEAYAQNDLVSQALDADLRTIEDTDNQPIELTEATVEQINGPTITPEGEDVDHIDDLGTPTRDLLVADIALIRMAGYSYLPAVAESLDKAHERVSSAQSWFEMAIRGMSIGHLGFRADMFNAAVARLDAAVTGTRDFIYRTGLKLVEIADGYYESDDESRQAMMSLFNEHNRTFEQDRYFGEIYDWSREKEEALRQRS